MRFWILWIIVFTILTLIVLFIDLNGNGEGGKQKAEHVENSTGILFKSDTLLTVMAVGDIMLGSDFPSDSLLPKDDGISILSEARPTLLASDITFGNLEGPLIDGGTTTKCLDDTANCFVFRMPTRYGRYIKESGFNILSLANNHALDFGITGRRSTTRILDSLGIAFSGPPGSIALLERKRRRIAMIAFGYDDDSYNLNRLEDAKELVRKLSRGNDIVIVSFHGGAEGAKYQRVPDSMEVFLGENRGHLRKFAHAMIDEGADLLLGHGPHVARGMEIYKDRLIAYSLGNFATYGRFNLNGPNGLSMILEIHLAQDGAFVGGKVHPMIQKKPGGPRWDKDMKVIPIIRNLSLEDFASRAAQVLDNGTILPPEKNL